VLLEALSSIPTAIISKKNQRRVGEGEEAEEETKEAPRVLKGQGREKGAKKGKK
jgi:hypothetical protein